MGYLQVLGAVSIWAFFNGVLVKGIKTSGVGVGMWTGMVGVIFLNNSRKPRFSSFLMKDLKRGSSLDLCLSAGASSKD